MWLAKEINKQKDNPGVLSASMVDYEVVGDYGEDNPCFLFPYGIEAVPPNNEELILLDTGKGRVCAGVVKATKDIASGEVKLCSSGGAYIKLTADGNVVINGVTITKLGQILKGV